MKVNLKGQSAGNILATKYMYQKQDKNCGRVTKLCLAKSGMKMTAVSCTADKGKSASCSSSHINNNVHLSWAHQCPEYSHHTC